MGLAAPVHRPASRSGQVAQLTLPFRVPPKEVFTIREVAEMSGMKETFIEEQFDAGIALAGFKFNGGEGKRHSKRIPRAWAVAFLVQHATWDDPSLLDAFRACLRHFPAAALLALAADCQRLAQDKPISS